MGRRLSEAMWRFAYAAVIGASHTETATPCQDFAHCEVMQSATGEPLLIAVAADGAGSASYSAQGAQMVCKQLIECVRSALQAAMPFADIDQATVLGWLEQSRQAIELEAEFADADSRDFACTLLFALVGLDAALFAQVGDGAMVIASADDPSEYHWVFWPERGDYANTTRFITDADFVDHLQFCRIDHSPVLELAVFTDGLQHLALQYEPPRAFAPFFNGFFPPVRRVAPEAMPELSKTLAIYLNSPRINARTDDDKSLILATRSA